jgi:ABC-2 type transport system ATP-binding protein
VSGDVLVRAEGLVRRYGALTAVAGILFEVRRSEMFGLIGPDGAGKTTTLRTVLGLLPPSEGRITTCGLDPWRQRLRLARRVGYLSQRFSLYGDLTVDENIAFFADLHGVRGWQALRDELLEMVRMAPFRKRLTDRLSGGMKQKLALACTLVHTPELLVLDEPTTGVDPVSRRDFWKLLARLQRQGLTILVTTPYLDEAERCTRVALMDHGRLLVTGAPDALREGQPGVLLEVVARPRRRVQELLKERPEVSDVEVFGERLHVTLGGHEAAEVDVAAARLADYLRSAGVELLALRPATPSLEDVFIARIRGIEGGTDSHRGGLDESSEAGA